MHVPTGDIVTLTDKEIKSLLKSEATRGPKRADQRNRRYDLEKKLVELTDSETKELKKQPRRQRKNIMRNKPCVCGSGIKFKRCCWSKFE